MADTIETVNTDENVPKREWVSRMRYSRSFLAKLILSDDKIKEYYDNNGLDGYNYAYVYPGMNKVMQAIGRVIRDEKDRGAVLLIDERYALNDYRELFKKEWDEYEMIFSIEELKQSLQDFYIEKWYTWLGYEY